MSARIAWIYIASVDICKILAYNCRILYLSPADDKLNIAIRVNHRYYPDEEHMFKDVHEKIYKTNHYKS